MTSLLQLQVRSRGAVALTGTAFYFEVQGVGFQPEPSGSFLK